MVINPRPPVGMLTHPDLLTPVLTREIADYDFERRLTPITIYAESLPGNPFNAPFVVRYVMNFPGLLGGDSEYPPGELCFGYSQILAEAAHCPDNVLFIPTSDPVLFSPEPRMERNGSCFYAGKYKYFHEGELLPITQNSVEITRDRPDSQTPAEIAELFRKSEVFYCYENSALAIEAVLCECPVVFLPNKYFGTIIAERELGTDGIAWGEDPDALARAKATVALARARYLRTFDVFWSQLDTFVRETKRRVELMPYVKPVEVPQVNPMDVWRSLQLLHIPLGTTLPRN